MKFHTDQKSVMAAATEAGVLAAMLLVISVLMVRLSEDATQRGPGFFVSAALVTFILVFTFRLVWPRRR